MVLELDPEHTERGESTELDDADAEQARPMGKSGPAQRADLPADREAQQHVKRQIAPENRRRTATDPHLYAAIINTVTETRPPATFSYGEDIRQHVNEYGAEEQQQGRQGEGAQEPDDQINMAHILPLQPAIRYLPEDAPWR